MLVILDQNFPHILNPSFYMAQRRNRGNLNLLHKEKVKELNLKGFLSRTLYYFMVV